MAFIPVSVTDGTTVKIVETSGEYTQAIWDGWWLTTEAVPPRTPTFEDLNQVQLALLPLLKNPILAVSFASWYAANGGSVVVLSGYELLTESSDNLITELGDLIIAA